MGDAALLVGTRVGWWLGVQLGLAGVLLLVGRAADHRLAGQPGGGGGAWGQRPGGGGGLELGFAAYRVGSVLPFLAVWTALSYVFERRLLPVMAARWVVNAGTALALTLAPTT